MKVLTRRTQFLRYLRRHQIPHPSVDEEAVFENAKKFPLRSGTRAELLASLKQNGENATAASFYHFVLDQQKPVSRSPKKPKRILLIPGAFHAQFPEFNSDGQLVIELAKRWNILVETCSLPDFGTLKDCAKIISRTLKSYPDQETMVVSLSKGSADLVAALETQSELRAQICAWISIGGIIRGSFDCDLYLQAGARGTEYFRKAFARFICWLYGTSVAALESLKAGERSELAALSFAELPFPVTCIVAVPLPSHVSTFLAKRYRRLLRFGPNDGMSLLADSIYPGSRVIPVWGADHFFRLPHFSRVVVQALTEQLGLRE